MSVQWQPLSREVRSVEWGSTSTLNFITVTFINQIIWSRWRTSPFEVWGASMTCRRTEGTRRTTKIMYLIAGTLFYPIETILNRLYVQRTRTLVDNLNSGLMIKPVLSNYQGFFDCKKAILQNETNLGFYKGIGSLFLQFSLQFLIIKITKSVIKNYFWFVRRAFLLWTRYQTMLTDALV